MKTRPVVPGATPVEGATAGEPLSQLRGRALQWPARWHGREHFVLLQLGWGGGTDLLACWQAWRDDPERCRHLWLVVIEPHPPADVTRAPSAAAWPELVSTLARTWPPPTANLHPLTLDDGRVHLLLGWGDAATLLPEVSLQVDAFVLPCIGVHPDPKVWDRHLFKALARIAATGASVWADSADQAIRQGLASAGFEIDGATPAASQEGVAEDPTIQSATTGRYAPRFQPRRSPATAARAHDARDEDQDRTPGTPQALVIGAGLAGAAAASALVALGWQVQVLDRHAEPAQETSGNPAGLFHGTVHPQDGVHARLFRAAALEAQRTLQPLIASGAVPGQLQGLLRLDRRALAELQALADAQGLPADFVRPVDAAEASALAGVPLQSPAWFYPGGGWVAPPALVRAWLRGDGVRFTGGVCVDRLQRRDDAWQVIDASGGVIAQAPVLVLANAADAARLLAPLGHDPWPLQRTRGQVSGWRGEATGLRLPVAGDGYALPLQEGGLLCGATVGLDDDSSAVLEADQRHNFERLRRLTGLAPPVDPSACFGRVGWRLQADDRLPLVGPMPLPGTELADGLRLDQPRFMPRTPGLHVFIGLGSRGITLAPLMASLLAARIASTPWPLERDLADAVDPARWLVRRRRRGA